MGKALLRIKGLELVFKNKKGTVPAIHGVDLSVERSEILGIVGESGSGKTLTALSVMQLLPHGCSIQGGSIRFDGMELTGLSEKQMQTIRGKNISMIFQDPMVALDPVYKCGEQISEALLLHTKCSKEAAKKRALELLDQMGIPNPVRYYECYPHELSGGMCQRVMIAIALSCSPQLLIADEPTTALDVTVQAKILRLLKDMQRKLGMSIILITHDLGVIAEIADRIAVMYMGRIVESGSGRDVFYNPSHPYTRGLIMSIPRLDQNVSRLYSIEGNVPSIDAKISGCCFCARCPEARERCRYEAPPETQIGPNHTVRCWLVAGEEADQHA